MSTRVWERNAHAHCINGARLNNRPVPNLPDVVVLTSIGGLLEIVVQRRVEDAELRVGDLVNTTVKHYFESISPVRRIYPDIDRYPQWNDSKTLQQRTDLTVQFPRERA